MASIFAASLRVGFETISLTRSLSWGSFLITSHNSAIGVCADPGSFTPAFRTNSAFSHTASTASDANFTADALPMGSSHLYTVITIAAAKTFTTSFLTVGSFLSAVSANARRTDRTCSLGGLPTTLSPSIQGFGAT